MAAKRKQQDEFIVEPHWLNRKQMAAALGISVVAFDTWGVKPAAQRHERGESFYVVRDVLDNRLEWQRKRLEKAAPDLDAAELTEAKERAELAWTEARAEGQRLKNAALRRELAPVAMVQWAISQAGSQIAATMGTIKGKVKRAMPSLNNAALHEIEQLAIEAQNVAADVKLDWDDFDESDLRDPRSDQ